MIAKEILQQIGRLKGLKTAEQMYIDYLLDKLMYVIFTLWDNMVLGGGTCINRFYGCPRFSRDLDIYSKKKINMQLVVDQLLREGLNVELSKGIEREFLPYYFKIKIWGETIIIKIDLMFSIPDDYTMVTYESTYPDIPPFSVNILNITTLLREKIKALLSDSRWKVADAYDIYFICRKYRLDWKKFCELDEINEVKERASYLIKRDWKTLRDILLEDIDQDTILRCFK